MAIKVKHDMNAAPAAAAGVASGRARRSMETARMFASGSGGGGRGGTQGATAHPVAPMGAHAQLTHASAPAVSAHAPSYHDTVDDRMRMQEEQNRAAMERQQLGLDWDKEKLSSQQEFTTERDRLQNQFQSERDKAMAKQRQDEWDRQHGILRRDKEADLIAAGTHEYGYSPEVQREYDALQREYDEGLQAGRYVAGSADERAFMDEMERRMAALPKTVVPRTDLEGQYRQRFYTDGNGRLIDMYTGKMVDSPEQLELRRAEMQMRRQDAEDKAFRDFDMKLDQGYRATEPIIEHNPTTGEDEVKGYKDVIRPYTDAQKEAFRRRHFPQRYQGVPEAEVPVQAQPAAPQDAMEQARQAVVNGVRNYFGGGAQSQPSAQPVIRQDSQGVSWEIVFDQNGKPIGKRRR